MNASQQNSGPGCIGKIFIALAIVAVLVGAFGAWGYVRVAGKIRAYSAGTATPQPVENASDAEYESLIRRMNGFRAAPTTLRLSAHDLNMLLTFHPEWKSVRGKIRFDIDGTHVVISGSIPLSSLPLLRERFLSGAILFVPTMENNMLHVKITAIKTEPNALPEDSALSVARGIEDNFRNRLLGDPVVGTLLKKSQTLKIENDSLIFSGR